MENVPILTSPDGLIGKLKYFFAFEKSFFFLLLHINFSWNFFRNRRHNEYNEWISHFEVPNLQFYWIINIIVIW